MQYKDIVRAAIMKSGMTYKEMAEETGYSEFSIYSWANGKHIPSFNAVDDLCQAAGLRIAIVDENGREIS